MRNKASDNRTNLTEPQQKVEFPRLTELSDFSEFLPNN
jgi:hypothetical protein